MEIKDLQGKLVAVLGYGLEGKAVAAYLLKHGVKPVLFDQLPWEQWPKDEQEKIKSLEVNFIFGPDCFLELKGFDVAFRSPGIRLVDIKNKVSDKTIITSQTKYFFDNCPGKIIGVTGTKGKGTTAALTSEMLKLQCQITNSKYQTYLTGNIGKTQPLEILDGLKTDDWIVYELSSFQLQDLEKSPHIGVVLMVTSEHLDYHQNTNEYIEAKQPVVKFQGAGDFAVINADFPASVKIGELSTGKKLYFSRKQTTTDCYVKDAKVVEPSTDFELPIASLQLRGEHNLENVMAAILAAKQAGCSDDAIKLAATAFKGLEHRLEFVAEKGGIKFYNDSFSTTPETAIAAIKSFGENLIIILGGQTKHSDFTELGKTIAEAKNIKSVILIGDEKFKIQTAIKSFSQNTNMVLSDAKNMPEIFEEIYNQAKEGDVVLFSPACTSFDMFDNYKQRGELFKQQVLKW